MLAESQITSSPESQTFIHTCQCNVFQNVSSVCHPSLWVHLSQPSKPCSPTRSTNLIGGSASWLILLHLWPRMHRDLCQYMFWSFLSSKQWLWVWEFEIVSIFVKIKGCLTFLKFLMYKPYSTARCDANAPSFMANRCGLREERLEQICTSREVGNFRLTLY